jgi:hypothetical protein
MKPMCEVGATRDGYRMDLGLAPEQSASSNATLVRPASACRIAKPGIASGQMRAGVGIGTGRCEALNRPHGVQMLPPCLGTSYHVQTPTSDGGELGSIM